MFPKIDKICEVGIGESGELMLYYKDLIFNDEYEYHEISTRNWHEFLTKENLSDKLKAPPAFIPPILGLKDNDDDGN